MLDTRGGTCSNTPMTNAQTAPAAPTILDEVRDFITSYVSLPDEAYADVLALYVLHTHAFNAARTTPYIYLTSQGPGSGKTRVLEVLSEVCRGATLLAGITGPTMFHLIEARKPTLMIDEVDTIYSGAKDEALRGVLNSGYKHNGKVARIDRSADDGMRDYSTFCPKVLAGIDNGQVPDTIMDRSIKIVLSKAKPGAVQPFYSEDVEDTAADLIADIQTWVAANMDALVNREHRPAPIESLSDRQNDIARPLLIIADRFHGWHKRARVAFARVFGEQATPLTPQAAALATVRAYMVAHDLDRIASAKIMELTGQNGKQIGAWFAAFGVKPGTYIIDGKNSKGYKLEAFVEAWERYLPALDASNGVTNEQEV